MPLGSTENLGWVQAAVSGAVAPSNTMQLWYDTNAGQMKMKRYDVATTSWVYIGFADEPNGGTGQTSYVKGDILYSDAVNSLAKLAIGTTGQVLKVDASGVPVWGTVSSIVTSGDATSGFGANRVPYFNGSSQWASNSSFLFDGTNMVVGHTSASARFHVRGDSNSTGSALIAQRLDGTELVNFYNNRKMVIGSGSQYTNGSSVLSTDFTINAIGGVNVTDMSFAVIGTGTDNIFRISNGSGYTSGGAYILRSAATSRRALYIGNTLNGANMSIGSSGVAGWNTGVILSDFVDQGNVGLSTDTTYYGMVYNVYNDHSLGHHFIKNIGGISSHNITGKPFMSVRGQWGQNNNTGVLTIFSITPTMNYTGTGAQDLIGFNYDPTLTSLTGVHYGMLVRSGMVAFNMGATLPTNYFQLGAGDANKAAFTLTHQAAIKATAATGDFEYHTVAGNKLLSFTRNTVREVVLTGAVGAAAPATNAIGAIADYFGTSATRVLTTPNTWISVIGDDGAVYKLPAYS